MEVIDFGLKEYGEVLERQRVLFNGLVENKKEGKIGKEFILIGEHYPVITLGRRAKEENVLLSEVLLNSKGIKLYHIERGGDVTFHNPGQLIIYPIIDLERHKLGVKDFVSHLEECVIQFLGKYGIKGERIEGKTGVWIGKGTNNERKICAIGIKCSRFCTMHGLALNICNDLEGFSLIFPCGFKDKGVTSMKTELMKTSRDKKRNGAEEINSNEIKVEEIKKEFLQIFLSLL